MAAGATYTPIATTTISSTSATITLSSIPSTYTDLVLVARLSTASASARGGIQFNFDGATNYSWTYYDSSNVSLKATSISWIDWYAGASVPANTQISLVAQINNYSNTTTNKTVLCRSGAKDQVEQMSVGLYRSTAAISSFSITSLNGSYLWDIGSTVTLYGIAAA